MLWQAEVEDIWKFLCYVICFRFCKADSKQIAFHISFMVNDVSKYVKNFLDAL